MDEERLVALERTMSSVAVAVARIEERQKAHSQTTDESFRDLQSRFAALEAKVEPLREAHWKQAGRASLISMIVSAAIAFGAALLRMHK